MNKLVVNYVVIVILLALPASLCRRPLFQERLENLDDAKNSVIEKHVNFFGFLAKGIADWVIPTANYVNASKECLFDSNLYRDSLANLEGWALKMYDASGKMPDGIASYNMHAFGHYDQCLEIQYEHIRGKYCTVFLRTRNASEGLVEQSEHRHDGTKGLFGLLRLFTLLGPELDPIHKEADNLKYPPLVPSIAFCLPSSCTAEDVASAVADKISRYSFGDKQIVVILDENYCYTADSKEKDLDAAAVTVLTVLSILGLFLLLGTVKDVWQRHLVNTSGVAVPPGLVYNVLLSFSILSNGEKILDTRQGSDSLPCLHGIRFISMTWVILGHVWVDRITYLNANPYASLQDARSWPMQALTNATPSVDTFFFLSGLLVAYVMLKELDKRNGAFNPLLMYLHRYLRLTPVYAVVLGFLATLAIYMGSGPFWQGVRSGLSDNCRKYWWQHLLYINNFNADDTCMPVTWYLANDMQMFLVAPFFVYALWKWNQIGLIILSIATLGFLAVSMAIIGIENLPPTLIYTRTDVNPDFYMDYYVMPWTRIPPYLVGIFIGYFLYKTKGKKVTFNCFTVVSCWILAVICGVSVIYGLHDYFDPFLTADIPLAVSIIYGSVSRFVFAACVGWVVFACLHGYGGFVNTLLSWKGFIPLSRLTYCTYLIHLNWIDMYYSRIRTASYYTELDQTMAFFGHLVFSMGIAFITSTCVESPFLNLEKLLFTPKKKT